MKYAAILLLLAGCAQSNFGEKACVLDRVELRIAGKPEHSSSVSVQNGYYGASRAGVIWSTGLQFEDGIVADNLDVLGHELMHLSHDACPEIFADPDE